MDINFKYTLDDASISLGYKQWIRGSQNRHLHDNYEILYVVTGNRNMFIGNKTYEMKGGDMIIIPPNNLHKSFNNICGSEIYSLYIVPDEKITHIIESSFEVMLLSTPSDYINNRFVHIAQEFKNRKIGYETIIKAYSSEILITLIRKMKDFTFLYEKNNLISPRTLEIVKYINLNFHLDINLCSLGKLFNISTGHLCRTYSRETGFNLIDYINHVRIVNAKRLLLTTTLKISKISEQCGFGSLTNFGRVFKRITDISPGNYRKQ